MFYQIQSSPWYGKGKGRLHATAGYEFPRVRVLLYLNPFLTSALQVLVGQHQVPAALTREIDAVTIV